jgi:hypothetical protein
MLHCTIQSDRMPRIHVLLHLEARTVPSKYQQRATIALEFVNQ